VVMATRFALRLDERRRPSLPVALLEEAGISMDAELVAEPLGDGRLVIETVGATQRAARERIHSRARSVAGTDGQMDIRRLRTEDARIADANLERRRKRADEVSDHEVARREKALLEALGL